MKFSLLITILAFTWVAATSQVQKEERLSKYDMVLQGNIESNEGLIILNDGKELIGLVAYNDKTGILKFERGNDSRSLTARNVLGFEVYDPDFDGNRIFYSLQSVDLENDTMRPFFFELIKDFKSFAVLSRKAPIDFKQKTDWNPISGNNLLSGTNQGDGYGNKTKLVVQQIETFYLLWPQEDPKPYFFIIVENSDKKSLLFNDQKTIERFVDKDLFQEYAGPLFEKVKTYARENHLSFKEKSDFLKILEYYETLID